MNSAKYSINTKQAISETLEGETIIINLETGNYYSLNDSGSEVWNAIKGGQELFFETDSDGLDAFLTNLLKENLIVANDAEIDPTMPSSGSKKLADAPKLEKYEDMQEMLLADPIHDVESSGWPTLKK